MEKIRIEATEPFFGTYIGWIDLNVHDRDKCEGQHCCIHNPSSHHMRDWPQLWRADRGMMERKCPHGTHHPDPDDLNPNTIHGCDGCCTPGGWGINGNNNSGV